MTPRGQLRGAITPVQRAAARARIGLPGFSADGLRNALCGAWLMKGKTMFQMVTRIIKWVSLPVLLIGAPFSSYAASYELLVDLVICVGAIIFVQRAVRLKEYFWAAGLVAIAVVFSPISLVFKIFLLMGFTCIAAFVTWLTAFRTKPLLAVR
jgi:hypothetical protein